MRLSTSSVVAFALFASVACDDCGCNKNESPAPCDYICPLGCGSLSSNPEAYAACLSGCDCQCYGECSETPIDAATTDASTTDASAVDASASDAASNDAGRTAMFCQIVCAERVEQGDEPALAQCMSDCFAGLIP